VVVAHVPLMSFAILYSAVDNGYMAEEGIQVELQRVASGTDAVGFLAQGQVDVGAIGLAGGIFNAFNRGFDMRIVSTASAWGQKHDVMILGAADKVKSGELKTVGDLKGKRVAIAGGGGSAGAYVVDAGLRTVGLTIKDVQVVNIANADIPLALKNGSVDGGLAGVPFANQAVSEGWGAPLLQNWEAGAATTSFLYSGKFMKERPAVAERFMVALMKGSRAMQGADYGSEKNMAIWEKYTGVKPDVIKAGIPLDYSPDMAIAKENIVKQEQGHREGGFTDYQSPVPLDKMIDESWQQKALAKLGPYRR
jgi:NitT/TauT family transport system substrate-binding protein